MCAFFLIFFAFWNLGCFKAFSCVADIIRSHVARQYDDMTTNIIILSLCCCCWWYHSGGDDVDSVLQTHTWRPRWYGDVDVADDHDDTTSVHPLSSRPFMQIHFFPWWMTSLSLTLLLSLFLYASPHIIIYVQYIGIYLHTKHQSVSQYLSVSVLFSLSLYLS